MKFIEEENRDSRESLSEKRGGVMEQRHQQSKNIVRNLQAVTGKINCGDSRMISLKWKLQR